MAQIGRKQEWPPRIFTRCGRDRIRLYVGGVRKLFTLGISGSPEAKAEYARLLAEAESRNHVAPLPHVPNLTVAELLVQYLKEKTRPDQRAASRQRRALKRLRELYGHTEARLFAPRGFAALQATWVKEELSRRYVQHLAKEVRQFFRWAVAEEYIPESVANALWYTEALAKDACPFRPRIRPVEDSVIDQTLPHLSQVVADMVRLQRWTGARPGEVCALRPCDIDRNWKVIEGVPIWLYKLDEHKTDWRGHLRWLPIGPRGQAVLLPYLDRSPDAYCFSPREAAQQALEKAGRKVNFRRARAPGLRYTTDAYDHALRQACKRIERQLRAAKATAGEHVDPDILLFPKWSPNQVRHQVGTVIETELGREDARCALGHKHQSTTAIYAEQVERAARVFARFG